MRKKVADAGSIPYSICLRPGADEKKPVYPGKHLYFYLVILLNFKLYTYALERRKTKR